MLHRVMAAGFQNVIETNHITFDVSIRIRDGIANTSLRAQIDHNIRMVLLKNTVDECLVRKAALDKDIVLELLKLGKACFLDANIIIIVHIVQTNDFGIWLSGQNTLCKVGTDEAGRTGDEDNYIFHDKSLYDTPSN